MSGIYDSVIGQRQELFANGAQQGRMVAAGQIGPADAFPEQYVAANEKTLFRTVKPKTSGGMSRQEKNG